MKGGGHPSPFVALSLPGSKKVTAGLTERVLQSSNGEAQPRIHDLTATFCTITEPFLLLDYGAFLNFPYFSTKTYVLIPN